jgi:Protein of unknown function (DUF3179)
MAVVIIKNKTAIYGGFILLALSLFCVGHAFAENAPVKPAKQASANQSEFLPLSVYTAVIGEDEALALAALKRLEKFSDEASTAMLVEMVYQVPSRNVLEKLIALIEKKSGRAFNGDVNALYEWLWSSERPVHPDYAEFKSVLYSSIDPRFSEYFSNKPKNTIRLDEIRWGGVRRDGIPPLKNPKMISAKDATWLQDGNVVFGVAINGDIRAYPKRILAWHEMFKDRIGGLELAGVYCTLCGALVLYDTTVDGTHYELGTSGFLYRSNKLMYDHATKSMWSTLTGKPVVGKLVGKNIKLKSLFVVTTTWKEWRSLHPNTQVLSLETGHQRDYDEGVAYHNYFASDELMFNVPKRDARLPNKAEVLALRPQEVSDENLAIAADFLAAHPVYHTSMGKPHMVFNMVVLTDASGANRVYESKEINFVSWDKTKTALDSTGKAWKVEEAQMTGPKGEILKRVPAHRAFWFGWYAAFPDTKLIK